MAVDIGLDEGTREAIRLISSTRGTGKAMRRDCRARARLRAGLRVRGEAGNRCWSPAKTARWSACCSASRRMERASATRSSRASSRRCCRRRLSLRPRGRGPERRRWPSFCRAIAFRVMSRQNRARAALRAQRRRRRPPRADRPRRRHGARSRQHAGQRHGAGGAFRRRARTRRASRSDSRVVVGGALLTENFPLIHAVGRASAQAPRLVDFVHGPEDALKVTLVGKGVCFDTGGLDIKPSSSMLPMKKDMGGAAVALSLASMLLEGEVPVRLRVILPIVENSVSASAYRPGDVYRGRKGFRSRSATPTRKVGSCWPTRWRSPPRTRRTCCSISRR